MLARGEPPPGRPLGESAHRRPDWPDELHEIVYIDHYGNAMSGLRAAVLPRNACYSARGLSAISRRAPLFGTRILPGLPRSPLIKGVLIVSSVSRLVLGSK
jgi:S-adenosyl-L-methionine hydrolase (adenosine-forming)